MRRSLSSLVNRKLRMGFQSWLGANAADAVAQDQRDTARSLLHLLHRELSRGWAGWQAQWHESLRKRESARRGLSLLASRQLSAGWNSWATMATERREAMELMRRSLSCLVSRNRASALCALRALGQHVLRKRMVARVAESRAAAESAA